MQARAPVRPPPPHRMRPRSRRPLRVRRLQTRATLQAQTRRKTLPAFPRPHRRQYPPSRVASGRAALLQTTAPTKRQRRLTRAVSRWRQMILACSARSTSSMYTATVSPRATRPLRSAKPSRWLPTTKMTTKRSKRSKRTTTNASVFSGMRGALSRQTLPFPPATLPSTEQLRANLR